MRSVVFDLDGTLADTSGDLIEAANVCFRGLGLGDLLDPVADAVTAFHGGRAMLTLGFSRVDGFGDAAIEAQYPVLLQAYGDAIDVHTTLYPGAMQAVADLKSAGYPVGICTNKPEALAQTLLTRMGIRDAFDALVGADTLSVRKPNPAPLIETVTRLGCDPKRTCLIGDTITDRDTARAAGVPSVLVTFGPAGMDVAALNPDALIGHFDELPDIVTQLDL
ncbi:HAD-IA family hydrolase [Aestuariibius sp. HNIBRBA575]|uniref:HAD-IA family hydrolase n=1 Tax=Aestuariibius sp. HNIBRBA575 TaxID=3233343 RepID=UPI0034A2276E